MKTFAMLALLATGCASYSHTRNDPTTGKAVESTRVMAPWLTRATVAGLKTRVTDKHGTDSYTRSVGLESGDARADVEGMDALNRLIGNAVISGLKAAAPVPVP